jgi:hypothetical protein
MPVRPQEPEKPKFNPPVYEGLGATRFPISDNVSIVCEHSKRGFTHIATLYVNGEPVDSARINYQNRTYESYEFQSVMGKLVDGTKALTDAQKKMALGYIDKDMEKYEEGRVASQFRTIGAVAMLGEVMGQTRKEKNDWKERMLKAGLGGKGLEMPDDWNTLDEKTKEERLNKVIALMKEGGN